MKLKFKIQPYQTKAVESVLDCFAGQSSSSGVSYRIAPGEDKHYYKRIGDDGQIGFKNSGISLDKAQVLENIQTVQRQQNLPISEKLANSADCDINLDIEMETGTGKTYCYIKTIFEMNQRYGWSKFIIVVPSIAIREGVFKSFEITADHFLEIYGKKARFFIYNSKQLHNLENFSSDASINVMIINIQAFNATGKDNRRIYEELDDFQSRRPIDVISNNQPILILDEPQKMEGAKTLEALKKFSPLMILRYSATHRKTHNKIHRLDALDAYNQKLVKKIAVRGVSVKGLSGANPYLYLEAIEISKKDPVARIEIEVRQKKGIKRVTRKLELGQDLFDKSNKLEQYRDFVVSHIDANQDIVEFKNGCTLSLGDVVGDTTEETTRRIQIREAIKAHFEKEQQLFHKGIKVLSLFFIDEVVKYRDYSQPDECGEYAKIFEEEYQRIKLEYLEELPVNGDGYLQYLNEIPVQKTHDGYFSIDKKTQRLADPKVKSRGEEAGLSDDVDAYDLILKDKERLLSFEEPVRFIFSHSALREGWDNPNVFVICMLKQSNNTISRRQEVGRGLRLAVNCQGERMDNPSIVHDINVLSVVASESYKDFVMNLQREIGDALSERPRKANKAYFKGKVIDAEEGKIQIDEEMARQIDRYLVKHDYTDDSDQLTETYFQHKNSDALAPLPDELSKHQQQIFSLIDSVFSESQLPEITNDRKPKRNSLNENFHKKEFKELWNRINHKAVYRVEFDSEELIKKSIDAVNHLRVAPVQYTVQKGEQAAEITYDQLKQNKSFLVKETQAEYGVATTSSVKYDLLGKISEETMLTRQTVARILEGIEKSVFKQFKDNAEHFLSEVSRIINEQKATTLVERLTYDKLSECYDTDIFTAAQIRQDFSQGCEKLKNHIYDYVVTDSKIEQRFAQELDTSSEVVVYAKLPRGFLIPTPVGDYNPDWAISFREGSVKHIYFVAETKGDMSSMSLRSIEDTKIKCARKFFDKINETIAPEHVQYDVVTSYEKLMEIVG